MDIKTGNKTAHVTLSERNLRDLLRAFERNPHSAGLRRLTEEGTLLYVQIETDQEHYKVPTDNPRIPGPGIDADEH